MISTDNVSKEDTEKLPYANGGSKPEAVSAQDTKNSGCVESENLKLKHVTVLSQNTSFEPRLLGAPPREIRAVISCSDGEAPGNHVATVRLYQAYNARI